MEVMNAYKILVTKPQGKKPYGRPRHRWEDNIVEFKETGSPDMDWIHLDQNRVQWLQTGYKQAIFDQLS
jgi:hypothetical protein